MSDNKKTIDKVEEILIMLAKSHAERELSSSNVGNDKEYYKILLKTLMENHYTMFKKIHYDEIFQKIDNNENVNFNDYLFQKDGELKKEFLELYYKLDSVDIKDKKTRLNFMAFINESLEKLNIGNIVKGIQYTASVLVEKDILNLTTIVNNIKNIYTNIKRYDYNEFKDELLKNHKMDENLEENYSEFKTNIESISYEDLEGFIFDYNSEIEENDFLYKSLVLRKLSLHDRENLDFIKVINKFNLDMFIDLYKIKDNDNLNSFMEKKLNEYIARNTFMKYKILVEFLQKDENINNITDDFKNSIIKLNSNKILVNDISFLNNLFLDQFGINLNDIKTFDDFKKYGNLSTIGRSFTKDKYMSINMFDIPNIYKDIYSQNIKFFNKLFNQITKIDKDIYQIFNKYGIPEDKYNLNKEFSYMFNSLNIVDLIDIIKDRYETYLHMDESNEDIASKYNAFFLTMNEISEIILNAKDFYDRKDALPTPLTHDFFVEQMNNQKLNTKVASVEMSKHAVISLAAYDVDGSKNDLKYAVNRYNLEEIFSFPPKAKGWFFKYKENSKDKYNIYNSLIDSETNSMSIKSGLKCKIFRENFGKEKLILSIGGTDNFRDIREDFFINGDKPPYNQYHELCDIMESLISKDLISQANRLVITGHSLGGGMAQMIAATYPEFVEMVYTYNAPGVQNIDAKPYERIKDFGRGNDVVENFVKGVKIDEKYVQHYLNFEKNKFGVALKNKIININAYVEKIDPTFLDKRADKKTGKISNHYEFVGRTGDVIGNTVSIPVNSVNVSRYFFFRPFDNIKSISDVTLGIESAITDFKLFFNSIKKHSLKGITDLEKDIHYMNKIDRYLDEISILRILTDENNDIGIIKNFFENYTLPPNGDNKKAGKKYLKKYDIDLNMIATQNGIHVDKILDSNKNIFDQNISKKDGTLSIRNGNDKLYSVYTIENAPLISFKDKNDNDVTIDLEKLHNMNNVLNNNLFLTNRNTRILSEFRSRVMHEINERETIKISADFN